MNYFQYNGSDMCISHSVDEAPCQKGFFMHTHAYAELYCFLGGRATFHVEGTAYALQPGDILLMRPAEAHYVQIEPSVPYERICMNFDTGILSSLDQEKRLTRPLFDRKAGKRNLYRLEGGTCMGYLRKMVSPAYDERLNILANLMLLLQELGAAFHSGQMGSSDPDTMEYRLIRYINKNLDRELTLQELCDRFFVSRTQLCRRFKEATGTSVGSYIAVKRLLTARQLLLQGQKPTEVFAACGYHDYSTFFRAYAKYFGHSPRDEQRFDYGFSPDAHIAIR